jgi:DHA1 family tetracycline resistance protein-like MFS transporter
MGAAFGIGFVLGPLLGGLVARDLGIRAPFYAAGAITLLNWMWGLWVLPESLPHDRRRPFTWAKANPVAAFSMIGRYPIVRGLAAMFFLFNVAQFGLHVVWVLYTGHRYAWGPLEVGLSLAVVGIGSAVVQGGLTRRLVPLLGEPRSLYLGLVLSTAAFIGYGLATHGWMIYAIIAIASLGAISGPAAQSLITQAVRADEQGETQGALASLQSVAQIIGPIIASTLFGYFISDQAPARLPGAPFFMGAILQAFGTLIAVATLRRHHPAHRPPAVVMAPVQAEP